MKKLIPIAIAITLLCCSAGVKYPTILNEVVEGTYAGANSVIVFDSTNIFLNRDGTGTTITHKLVKVFNAIGRKEFSEASFAYISLYDTVIILDAKVIKPDKKIIRVPKTAITDMPMPAWEGSKFYIPNLKIVKITFPELADGGAIEYKVKTITHNAPFDSTFDYWDLFEATEPIKVKVLNLSLPRDMRLKWVSENGGLMYNQKIADNRTLDTWEANDVAKVFMEPSMPPLENVLTKLLITCTDSWQDYSRWYHKLSEPKLIPDTAVVNKVNELTANVQTKDDTIRSLYEFVNQEIRYVETKLVGKSGGYEPARVGFTFKNRYGVCRDKAALLVAMLRTAGIKNSYMVLTNPMILRMKEDMPVASQFNHAIVAITTDTGIVYLDPTAEHSVDYLVSFEDAKPVLVCTEEGKNIDMTPSRPPEVNLTDANVAARLDEKGNLNETITIKASGMIDYQLRYLCQMMTREQIEQLFLSSFKQTYPNAKLDSFKTTDPKDFKTPMRLALFITIPDYVLKIGKEWHLSPGKGVSSFGAAKGVWNLSERRYPLYLWVKTASIAKSVIKFPDKLRIKSLPGEFYYEDDAIKTNITYKGTKGEITGESIFIFKTPEQSPDQYQSTKNCMEKIEEYQNQEIILEEK